MTELKLNVDSKDIIEAGDYKSTQRGMITFSKNAVYLGDGDKANKIIDGETDNKFTKLLTTNMTITLGETEGFSDDRYGLINAINANLSRFIYCDTDSIYLIGNEKPNGINLSNKLGDWKLEHVCDKFLVLGNKTYGLHDVNTNEDVFKIAGLNKDDIADITWNDFKFGNKVTCHQLEASSNGLTMIEKEFTLGYKQIDEIPESFVVDMIEQLLEIDDEYRAYASYKEYYEQNKLLKGAC